MSIKIEDFKLFKYPWDTDKGLFYNSFYYIALFLFLILTFKSFLSIKTIFYFWACLFVVFLISWLIKRKCFIYFNKKFHIIFAVTIDYEDKKLLKNYTELINDFKERLKDYNLSKNIKLSIKHFDIYFSDHSAAEAMTKYNALGSTLIISGFPIISSKETEFKFNWHYEFLHPRKGGEEFHKKEMNKKISKSMIGKQWRFMRSIDSKKMVYGNLFIV